VRFVLLALVLVAFAFAALFAWSLYRRIDPDEYRKTQDQLRGRSLFTWWKPWDKDSRNR
jgi:hypothetical protein